MLRDETRDKIQARVRGLLHGLDAEAHLLDVILDSTRQQLAFIIQKGELPLVLGMNWLDYVSRRDAELSELLKKGLEERVAAAQRRAEREEAGAV